MILHGDCVDQLKVLADNSVDALVTDPPYGLSQMKSSDIEKCLASWVSGEDYEHGSKGFMGKKWDNWVPSPSVWREVFRVMKHGAHGLVFAGSRTQDLMSISLRLAGFEVRDTCMWLYGSGFPKSHNIALRIDKKQGHPNRGKAIPTASSYQASDIEKQHKLTSNPVDAYTAKTSDSEKWVGWGTALKPAYEPIILIRKPLEGTIAENVLKHGVGGINIDATRIKYEDSEGIDFSKVHEQKTASYEKSGWTGHVAKVGSKIQSHKPSGRWPANILLDETTASMLDEQSGTLKSGTASQKSRAWGVAGDATISGWQANGSEGYRDAGGASRFFYTAKASKKEREAGLAHLPKKPCGTYDGRTEHPKGGPLGGPVPQRTNTHPTVKPLNLMRYCVRMVTPKGGTVLDPFCGSGSTLCAGVLEGFEIIGIERESEYVEIAKRRVDHWREDVKSRLL